MAGNVVSIIFNIDPGGQGQGQLTKIEVQIKGLGTAAQGAGSQIEGALGFLKSAVILEFFRQGALSAFEFGKAAVQAFNEAQAAALGLQTVAKSAGVDPGAALDAVKNLALVKNGLLTVAEASIALKNNLRTGFSLDQSIDLIKKFGDAAAFNKQSAISFGDAVVRTSEGIRQNLSTLADAGGITTNLSVILGRAGLTFDDLTDKTNGQANATKFYNELLKETAAFTGDAERKSNTFAGQTDALAAKQKVLMQTIGEIIAGNPELQKGFKQVGDTIAYLTSQLNDSESSLNRFVNNASAKFGALIEIMSKLASGINAIAAVANAFDPLGNALSPRGGGPTKDEEKARADTKKNFDKLAEDFRQAQKKLNADLAQAPILDGAALKKKAEEDKKAFAEMKRDSDAYFRKQEADEKLVADLRKKSSDALREVSNATAELQAKLSTNPLALAYDSVIAKQQQFLDKLKGVPKDVADAFTKASADVVKLDFFKSVFAQGQGLGNLLNERAKLQANGDPEKLARLQKENVDAQLRLLQQFQGSATNAAQRQFTLEQTLNATSGGNLTGQQRDIRANAINELITVQQAAFKENFDRLKDQTNAQKENTQALIRLDTRLATLDEAFSNRKLESTIRIIDETFDKISIDLGSTDPAHGRNGNFSNNN